jgi:hypothetical protein
MSQGTRLGEVLVSGFGRRATRGEELREVKSYER